MEAYQRINFNQILLTLYNDSRLLFFKFLIAVYFILYAKTQGSFVLLCTVLLAQAKLKLIEA